MSLDYVWQNDVDQHKDKVNTNRDIVDLHLTNLFLVACAANMNIYTLEAL